MESPLPSELPHSKPLPYLIQLDALRAIAISGVIVAHYLPPSWWINNVAGWGYTGVRLFFVISGFLITGILLRARKSVISGQQTLGKALKIFYIRRALRIFPIYYLILAIAFAVNVVPVRESIFWHLTYTTNFYIALAPQWPGAISVFWSLAVEEQFYLIWPLFVLTCPQRWLKPGIVGTIVLAAVARYGMLQYHISDVWRFSSLITNLDLLGTGALLAYVNDRNPAYCARNYWLCRVGLWVGAPLYYVLYPLNNHGGGTDLTLTIAQTALAGCGAWLVQSAARGFQGIVGQILESKPVIQVGKLSYGIYVYHLLILDIVYNALKVPRIADPGWRFPISLAILLTTAYLSWKLIEQPILRLKQRFSYE
jgi:peptidoglycan/LPS O-acetylase OafA/YrhL